ncbi:protein PTHB1 [Euwallacea fornicatus]|uniref:protein PTHB1 n=1 Tax=Euwallacea fornicatus TaxID=995702 RepID=UPI00338E1FA8
MFQTPISSIAIYFLILFFSKKLRNMSLFKTRLFWSTNSEDDEYFDHNSLIVSKLNSEHDYIITGSQSGVLRIFSPNSETNEDGTLGGFHPNDVIVEKIFDTPILQVGTGRLLSGNQLIQLVLLHPRVLSVYSLVFKAGKTDHGNQTFLQLLYEHKLRGSAYNFAVGPFGGSQQRDFICVQSLDGVLSFFEQESQVAYVALPDFLLPGPLCYVTRTDSFVVVNCDWSVATYRYKILSEAADESIDPIYAKPKIFCEWEFNLGESVLDIKVINDIINKEARIVVLGEKNVFCITENGRLKFMNRLGYSPICIDAYILDPGLFTLVVAETGMLLVYENTTLKWSAHMDFLPVAISRCFLKLIKGALVALSDEGRLECCYLGTEPSFFVAPPLNIQEIDFAKAEQELASLEKVLTSSSNIDLSQNNIEKELEVQVQINREIEVCTLEHNIKNATNNYMSQIKIELAPHVTFQEVQVTIAVQRPLKAVPTIHFFSNLWDCKTVFSYVFLDEAQDIPSLEIEVKICVINNFGVPRTITRFARLPASLILEPCEPEKENKFKITLATDQRPVGLKNLFPEYSEADSASPHNALGFKGASGNSGTVLLAKSTEKFRLQSDSLTILSVLVELLACRLRSSAIDCKISLASQLPTTEIFNYANDHFATKQKVKDLQSHLSQLNAQFRLIQKRLIAKYRAKNPISLKSLELLLNDTYADILDVADKLENEIENLSKAQTNLSCSLHLVRQLIHFLDVDQEVVSLADSTFSSKVYDLDVQSWEDVMDASLCYLLRAVIPKTEKDRLRAPHTSFDEIRDLSKFEKHLSQVLERVPKHGHLKDSPEVALVEKECDAIEEEASTSSIEKPIGSRYGEFSSRLLSARKSLIRRHQINEHQEEDGNLK